MCVSVEELGTISIVSIKQPTGTENVCAKYRAKGMVLSRQGWVLRNTTGMNSEILPFNSAKAPECPQGCFPMLCAPGESARVPHCPTEATCPYSPPSSLFPSCLGRLCDAIPGSSQGDTSGES